MSYYDVTDPPLAAVRLLSAVVNVLVDKAPCLAAIDEYKRRANAGHRRHYKKLIETTENRYPEYHVTMDRVPFPEVNE